MKDEPKQMQAYLSEFNEKKQHARMLPNYSPIKGFFCPISFDKPEIEMISCL